MILPPQLLILSLFQILLQFGLYNTLLGLVLAYVATQLAMTVYILEGFFAQLPQDLFDAARMDGYSDFEIFWRDHPADRPAGGVHHRDSQLHHPVERVSLRRRAPHRRRQAHAAAGHHAFHGRHQLDVGMIATGLMISMRPIILLYALFSETLIKGMTAGAVR